MIEVSRRGGNVAAGRQTVGRRLRLALRALRRAPTQPALPRVLPACLPAGAGLPDQGGGGQAHRLCRVAGLPAPGQPRACVRRGEVRARTRAGRRAGRQAAAAGAFSSAAPRASPLAAHASSLRPSLQHCPAVWFSRQELAGARRLLSISCRSHAAWPARPAHRPFATTTASSSAARSLRMRCGTPAGCGSCWRGGWRMRAVWRSGSIPASASTGTRVSAESWKPDRWRRVQQGLRWLQGCLPGGLRVLR